MRAAGFGLDMNPDNTHVVQDSHLAPTPLAFPESLIYATRVFHNHRHYGGSGMVPVPTVYIKNILHNEVSTLLTPNPQTWHRHALTPPTPTPSSMPPAPRLTRVLTRPDHLCVAPGTVGHDALSVARALRERWGDLGSVDLTEGEAGRWLLPPRGVLGRRGALWFPSPPPHPPGRGDERN